MLHTGSSEDYDQVQEDTAGRGQERHEEAEKRREMGMSSWRERCVEAEIF